MAFSFDGVNDHIELTDHASLTFPDSDWSMSVLVYLNDISGSQLEALFSWGVQGTSPSFLVRLGENLSSLPNESRAEMNDSDGDGFTANSSGDALSSGAWLHFYFERNGNTLSQYIDNVLQGTETNTLVDAVDPAAVFRIGVREDLNAASRLDGKTAEFGKWGRVLTSDERTALFNRYAPSFFRRDLKVYMPMIRDYIEIVSGITVTNNGTTVVPHPRMIYPSGLISAPISGAFPPVKTFLDAGAEGAESFQKNVFVAPIYLKNKFEAITIKVLDS